VRNFNQKCSRTPEATDAPREEWQAAGEARLEPGIDGPAGAGDFEANGGIGTGPQFSIRIIDFIINRCEATHGQRFVDHWLVTSGFPCLICDIDKSACSFYRYLALKNVLGAPENRP